MSARAWSYIKARQARADDVDALAERIIAEVAARHRLSVADLVGPSHARRPAAARFEAMYLIAEAIPFSPQDIGSFFGCRDHTTVSRAIRSHLARVEPRRALAA